MSDSPVPSVAVALLHGAEDAGTLRKAIVASGAKIVFEAATRGFDRTGLDQSVPDVVVVDLRDPDDDELEELDALFDRYPVLFNDGEASSLLSGWDLARWQRHLGAKIVGGGVDPPRPADAEPVPEPQRPLVAEAASSSEIPDVTAEPARAGFTAALVDADSAVVPEVELMAADAAIAPEPAGGVDVSEDSAERVEAQVEEPSDAEALEFDLDDLGFEVPSLEAAPPLPLGEASAAPEIAPSETDLATVEALPRDDFLEIDATSPDAVIDSLLPASADSAETAAAAEASIDELDFDIPLDEVSSALAEPTSEAPIAEDPAAGVAAQLESPALSLEHDPGVPVEVEAATLIGSAEPVESTAVAREAEAGLEVPEWTLEDFGVVEAAAETPVPGASDAAGFGIETVKPADFLAPQVEEVVAAPHLPSEGFSLELVPLEEAVAPTRVGAIVHESRLESGKSVRVQRVWVLGASIGGPEALREFLAGIPHDYPALFLLVQHLGGEFLDLMARQLAKATGMMVRQPEHGDRVGHGEILLVPGGRELSIDTGGVVIMRQAPEEGSYSPSIDRILTAMANSFGANAGAIIFSGVGEDAVEGCRHLADKGGRVYLQSPDSCVVSAMVEAVQATGVASFVGSPRELAERLCADLGLST